MCHGRIITWCIIERVDRIPGGASSIGADQAGHIWMAHYISPSIVKFDTVGIVSVDQWDGARRVYNFSDMTGLVRRNAIGQGRYSEDIEAACDAPTWATLSMSADIPEGAEVRFIAYSANRRHKLDEATPVFVGSSDEGESFNVDARLFDARRSHIDLFESKPYFFGRRLEKARSCAVLD